MSTIDEKRVFSDSMGTTTVFVASEVGIVRVECSGGMVGEFGLLDRTTATAIDGDGSVVIATTADDLLQLDDGKFEPTGFGPATALTLDDGIVGARTDRIARYTDGSWQTCYQSESPPWESITAVGGTLVGTPSGVFRLGNGEPTPVGLDDVRGISVDNSVLCGTGVGLYRLENGWNRLFDGTVVDIARAEALTVAISNDRLYTHSDGSQWVEQQLPVDEPLAGVAIGDRIYVVTIDGTICIEDGDGWRTRSIGVPAVAGLAVR
ncbi:HVO_0234 family beta-propeller protein [Halocatena halophila]|uniref:HVO_0234 family beta-propeller protein n=1 Tax=Halocatena halophila TaxID=2814576 RepID=UPI002ED3CA21